MSVDGTWEISMSTPLGDRKFVLNCTESDGTLNGTLKGTVGARDIFAGKVDGNQMEWKANLEKPMRLTVSFASVVDGDSMSGQVKFGMFHKGKFSGVRV